MSNTLDCFTVLMSIYAKEHADYLRESLISIEKQTLLPNELVLVEDGPIGPELSSVIDEFRSSLNIVSVKLATNRGLGAALNVGLKNCSFELVARMDTDDICFLDRFEKQVNFMRNNPSISFSSGIIQEFDDTMTNVLNERRLPLEHDALVSFAKTRCPMSHPATIFRKSDILSVGGYPEMYPEDYVLWCLMILRGYKMANLPNLLLKFRGGEQMIARRGAKFLPGYIKTYSLMRREGLINNREFFVNVIKQSVVRLSPSPIRRLLYKHARS